MSRIRSGSGYPFENVYAYLRAIRAGNHVFVSGTTARPPDLEGDAYAGRGDQITQNSICSEIDALKFDYSAFKRRARYHRIFHCFIFVISFPTLCAATVEPPCDKPSFLSS
jgi:hypothetical protein